MHANSGGHDERDPLEAGAGAPRGTEGPTGRLERPCHPLEVEIEVLEEQINVLEDGLPRAPGMERAALAKEINGYRRQLDSKRLALSRCRGAGASLQNNGSDATT